MYPIITTFNQMVSKLVSTVHTINLWLLMPALLGLVLLDIILRNVFAATISWSHEVSGLLLLSIFFIDLPYCLSKHEFLKVDLFFSYFSKCWKKMANLLSLLCCFSVSIFLVWQGLVGFQDMFEFEEEALTLSLPLWPFSVMIIVSACLMALQSLAMILESYWVVDLRNE